MELNEIQEIMDGIDRGGPCGSCKADWVDAPKGGRGARELVHAADCAYDSALNALADRTDYDHPMVPGYGDR